MISLWISSVGLFFIAEIIYALQPNEHSTWLKNDFTELKVFQSKKNNMSEAITTHQNLQDFIQGNMKQSDKQDNIVLSGAKKQEDLKIRKRRTLVKKAVHKWEHFPILVVIDVQSGVDALSIREALKLWEAHTCVRFKELPTIQHEKSYIEFKFGNGCMTNIGRSATSKQRILLDNNCSTVGMVAHLIGHSLGLFHEQARYDRDDFVHILSSNIVSDYINQFAKRTHEVMETYSQPYDYGSLMHFSQKHFSQNGLNTIEPVDQNYRLTIGQRTKLTFSDAKKINFAYCKDVCQTELSCNYDGYTDPKNCSRCRCAEVFDGIFCDRARKTASAMCGINLDLECSEEKQKLELNGDGECHYVIKAQTGQVVELDVMKFEFEKHIPCESEYLEVRYGKHLSTTGARFCVSKPNRIISITNTMAISYRGSTKSYVALSFRCGASFLASTDRDDTDTEIPISLPTEVREKKVETKNASIVSTETVIKTLERTVKLGQKNIIIPRILVDDSLPDTVNTLSKYDIGVRDEWTQWSVCTANCGGCGTQQRNKTRPYLTVQSRYCNTRMCENNGCCLPFTYVFKGTCLRLFNDDNDNVTECDKQQVISTTATSQIPCVPSETAECEVAEEKMMDQSIYRSQPSIAVVSSNIDAENQHFLNRDNNNNNNNNNSFENSDTVSNAGNNNYEIGGNNNDNIRKMYRFDYDAQQDLIKRHPTMKQRLLAAQGRIRKVLIRTQWNKRNAEREKKKDWVN